MNDYYFFFESQINIKEKAKYCVYIELKKIKIIIKSLHNKKDLQYFFFFRFHSKSVLKNYICQKKKDEFLSKLNLILFFFQQQQQHQLAKNKTKKNNY